MSKKEILRRYIVFLFGLFISSFGIAFITKADLGTSPISSIPYSLSLIIPALSLGNWTIIFSVFLIILQIFILGKENNKIELVLQMAVSFGLGYFIDLSMFILKSFIPANYAVKIISLLIGCFILAFGIYLQVIADVVMLPGDAFVRAVSVVSKKDFGTVRVLSDISMTLVAGALCLTFLHKLIGVREGTVIAALIIGNIIKLFSKFLKKFEILLLPQNKDKVKTK